MRKIFTIIAILFVEMLPISILAQNMEILSQDDYNSAFISNSYNEKVAYWCARAARDAYNNSNNAMDLLGFHTEKIDLPEFNIPIYKVVGMNITKIDISVGLRGYIGLFNSTVSGKNVIMIAIRGSKTTSNWLSDFNAYPYNWETGRPSIPDNTIPDIVFSNIKKMLSKDPTRKVHGGFYLCTDKIWRKINSGNYSKYINNNTLFIITGHSLGGAISELLSLKLKDAHVNIDNIICYGFASPPVGDLNLKTYAGNLSNRIYKIKSNNDVVPNAGIDAYTLANQVKQISFSEKWTIDMPGNHCMDRYLQEILNNNIIRERVGEVFGNVSNNNGRNSTNNINSNLNTLVRQISSQKFPNNSTSDRWTNKATPVYSRWNPLTQQGTTLPVGTQIKVIEKINLSNGKSYAWFDPYQSGLPSGYVDADDLTDSAPSNNNRWSSNGNANDNSNTIVKQIGEEVVGKVSDNNNNSNTTIRQISSQHFPNNSTSDRWTNKATPVYSRWNPLTRQGTTLPVGTQIKVIEKINLSNGKSYAWFDPYQSGLPSGYVDTDDLTTDVPSNRNLRTPSVFITKTENIYGDRWINQSTPVYNDWNPSTRQMVKNLSKDVKIYVTQKYTLSNNETFARISDGYVNANNLNVDAPAPMSGPTPPAQPTYTMQAINADRWTNTNATVYSDWNPSTRRTVKAISTGTKVYVTTKYTLSNGEALVKISDGYVNANDLNVAAPYNSNSSNTTTQQPVINSFSVGKSEYNVGDNVTLYGSASNIGSWKIVWLKNDYEADAATGFQNNSNISYGGTVNNTAYNGAILYVYPQINGGGTSVTRRVSFTIKQLNPIINSFSTSKPEYNVGDNVTLFGSASNIGSWKVIWLKNGYEADAATGFQNNSNISYSGTVNNTSYNGAILYAYPLANGGGTPVTRRVNFMIKQPQIQPFINSFSANKYEYNVGENVSLYGSASNIGSWKVVWLRNGNEADAVTGIQNNNNISCSGTINNTAYDGAILYVYSQANGEGSPVTKRVNFIIKALPQPVTVINSFSANKSDYNVGENVLLNGSASNIGSWIVVWLKNGNEADAATGFQNNSIISCGGTVNNTAYNGAILYVYPQTNGGGTPVTRRVSFTVKAQSQQPQPPQLPNITISVQQNYGNGTIRVGGNYSDASHISIDCRNLTSNTAIANQSVNVGGGQWSYDKPVESGKRYRFAVRAYNTNGSEKWAEIEVTAR